MDDFREELFKDFLSICEKYREKGVSCARFCESIQYCLCHLAFGSAPSKELAKDLLIKVIEDSYLNCEIADG